MAVGKCPCPLDGRGRQLVARICRIESLAGEQLAEVGSEMQLQEYLCKNAVPLYQRTRHFISSQANEKVKY